MDIQILSYSLRGEETICKITLLQLFKTERAREN